MAKLDSILDNTPQHVGIMGDPGSGKSTLVGKLATEGFKLIWFSTDNGHSVLKKLPEAARNKIELIRLPDTRAWPVAWTTLNKFFDCSGKLRICDKHGSIECSVCKKIETASWTELDSSNIPLDTVVVIDHGTQLAQSCMNTVTKMQPVDYKPQLDDWGSLKFHLDAFGKKIQAAPFHVACLFQPEESKMEDGRSKLTPGWGSNNSSKTASQYFDHLVYCEVYNKSHKAGSSSTYSINAVAKSRTDIEIEKLKEPSLAAFFSIAGQAAAKVEDKKAAVEVLNGGSASKLTSIVPAEPSKQFIEVSNNSVMGAVNMQPAKELISTVDAKVATPIPQPVAGAALSAKDQLAKLREGLVKK